MDFVTRKDPLVVDGSPRGGQGSDRGPRLGVLGGFDVANYGDLLFPRIFELEVRRRCPAAIVRAFAPLGREHPVPLDGGRFAESLGPWRSERCAELADELDLLAIGGGELLHEYDAAYVGCYEGSTIEEMTELWRPSGWFVDNLGEHVTDCTVAWNGLGVPFEPGPALADRIGRAARRAGYVAVRDELSAERVRRCAPDVSVEVVPDTAILLDRLFPRELLDRRLRDLRAMGRYPAAGGPLLVHGSESLCHQAEAIALALAPTLRGRPDLPLATIEIGPCHGDTAFADKLAACFERPVHHIPASSQEDIAAAIGGAAGYVGVSLHGAITALAFGVPFVVTNLDDRTKLDGFARLTGLDGVLIHRTDEVGPAVERALAPGRPRDVAAARDRLVPAVDRHFDTIVELAEAAWRRRAGGAPEVPTQQVC